MLPTRRRLLAGVGLTVLTIAAAQQPHEPAPRAPVAIETAGVIRSFPVRADRGAVRDEPVAPSAPVATTSTVPVGVRYTPQRRPAASFGGVVPSADAWARLRQCESGGNYADRRNPTFRGGYQFSRSTWASVGGRGDPADASPAEQDTRARLLYARRGAQPWPVCGRYLR